MRARVLPILVLLAAVVALAPLPAAAAAAAKDWTATPFQRTEDVPEREVIDVNGAIGAIRIDRITITNPTNKTIAVDLAPVSGRSIDGTLTYQAPERANDPARWIVQPAAGTRLAVRAGDAIDVPVVVRIPNSGTVGQQLAAVRVAQIGTKRTVDVPVRIRIDGELTRSLTLTDSDLTYERPTRSVSQPGTATYTYRARNTGNTIIAGDLVVRLDTVFGRKVVLERRRDVVVLPGSDLSGTVSAKAWPTFTFVPELGVESTTDGPDGIELTSIVGDQGEAITVIPKAQLQAAAAGAVALLALWVVARQVARHRNRREATT